MRNIVATVLIGGMVGLVMCLSWALSPQAHGVGTGTEQVEPSYQACIIGPDPVNCTWDGIDNGTGTQSYWISPTERVWHIPHHIAHFLVRWDNPPRTEYMPCQTEDQHNCVWDARHEGNGMGQSFFSGKSGRVWLLPHHIAHYLLGLDRQPN